MFFSVRYIGHRYHPDNSLHPVSCLQLFQTCSPSALSFYRRNPSPCSPGCQVHKLDAELNRRAGSCTPRILPGTPPGRSLQIHRRLHLTSWHPESNEPCSSSAPALVNARACTPPGPSQPHPPAIRSGPHPAGRAALVRGPVLLLLDLCTLLLWSSLPPILKFLVLHFYF